LQLNGRSRIGYGLGAETGDRFRAVNPATGAELEPTFFGATDSEVRRAGDLAGQAFASYSRMAASERARFLRTAARNIEQLGETLVERAVSETGLGADRIRSERGRTANQLRLFADVIEDGTWLDARVDRPDPDRKPLPKPDVRSMLRPLGPVVVFGASNFPLAFSVAGGDTASALAAGNPVVVKAHNAHPGTAELVANAVLDAARECGMPEGVFSVVFGAGARVGTALVQHPAIKAGGFTGSRTAGKKLVEVANNRPEPIPFYAEMSSTNPVFVLPGALRERGEQISAGLHGSFTLGAGQFCTKPGMVFVEAGEETKRFAENVGKLVSGGNSYVLLTKSIHGSYQSGLGERQRTSHAIAQGPGAAVGYGACAAVFEADADSFIANPHLAEELFGPSTLLVSYRTREQMLAIARSLEGQLTATVHATAQDLKDYADLIAVLEHKVGRIVVNGFPTGVEVGHAMVHGGPHPATSDSRTSSVGSRAILRFARPVCYQNFPDAALPPELQDANPLGIWRMIDGKLTREVVERPVPQKA
jgi:NADP-dependent aldehyde dehydrogenase